MKPPQSLAEFLGVAPRDPDREPAEAALDVRPEKLSAKGFAQAILHSPQYRESLLRRILLDELPSAVEALLYHYAYGKPVEKIDIKDTTATPLEALTSDQLEVRAKHLLDRARQLRKMQEESQGSVH